MMRRRKLGDSKPVAQPTAFFRRRQEDAAKGRQVTMPVPAVPQYYARDFVKISISPIAFVYMCEHICGLRIYTTGYTPKGFPFAAEAGQNSIFRCNNSNAHHWFGAFYERPRHKAVSSKYLPRRLSPPAVGYTAHPKDSHFPAIRLTSKYYLCHNGQYCYRRWSESNSVWIQVHGRRYSGLVW
jgi:hypothetical protein